jgi:DNA-binding winged helix-turn-helix (wHTH) protein/Tol biopolymer transport system component
MKVPAPNGKVHFDPFELDLEVGELLRNGQRVRLPPQAMRLLELLASHPGKLISREQIQQHIWSGETFVDFEHGINKSIRQIRDALRDNADVPKFIETHPRRGYRFIAAVENDDGSKHQGVIVPSVVETVTQPAQPSMAEARPKPLMWVLLITILAIIGMGAAWVAWRVPHATTRAMIRLNVDLGADALPGLNTTVAISPDGSRIVFPTLGPGAKQQLATRLLDQAHATLLPGTENASDPFFSPDGQWLGFFADFHLKKISMKGGPPITLCAAANGQGGSWGNEGEIIAALSQVSGLSRVPDTGGGPKLLTRLAGIEATHRWPQILPGGKAVLFTASAATVGLDDAAIEVMQLKTGERKTLLHGGYFGRYLPGGHLLYLHQGVLFAVAFDLMRLEVLGTPVPVLDDVAGNAARGGGQFDFSGTGTFVYLAGKTAAKSWPIMLLDSSGKIEPLVTTAGVYGNPRFSPDGQRLAVTNGGDISIYDIGRATMTRLTFTENATVPVWTPDGNHIAFRSASNDGTSISWIRADGAGEIQRLLVTHIPITPYSFSPDGSRLAYFDSNSETGQDLWTLPLDLHDPDRPKALKPELFLRTASNELLPAFSPDGRWVAYRSDESGAVEIYVRPFPGPGGKRQISIGGGIYPIWSSKGRELFYETPANRIMVVNYSVNGDSFFPAAPRLWSDKQIFSPGVVNLAQAPDGNHFAVFPMPTPSAGENAQLRVTFLLNFSDELRRRIPVKR